MAAMELAHKMKLVAVWRIPDWRYQQLVSTSKLFPSTLRKQLAGWFSNANWVIAQRRPTWRQK